jgi:hypothetical protein
MIRVRGMLFKDGDDALDYFEQRKLDDAIHEAHVKGRKAGLLQVPAGANEYPAGSPEAAEWERARSAVEAQRASEAMARRARRSCDACTCGGRGLCLADAA